jgi:hypothetical protein
MNKKEEPEKNVYRYKCLIGFEEVETIIKHTSNKSIPESDFCRNILNIKRHS